MSRNTKNIIAPFRTSYAQIRADLEAWLAEQDDADAWKDFFVGGVGTTITELVSAMSAFLKYSSTSALRESSILTARLKSVVYNMAYHLDYPINRARSAVFKYGFSVSELTYIDRAIPIATMNGQNLSVLTSQSYTPGTHTVHMYMGTWTQETKVHEDDSAFGVIAIPVEDVDRVDTNLVEIYIDNVLTPTSKFTEDIYTGVLIQSTLSDAIGLKTGSSTIGMTVTPGSTIDIKYLQLDDTQVLNTNTYLLSNVESMIPAFQPITIDLVTPYSAVDSLQKITTLAPAYHSSQRRMITPADHEAILNSYPGMRTVGYSRGVCTIADKYTRTECILAGGTWTTDREGCCTPKIAYLFEDGHVISTTDPEEELAILDYLEPFSIAGSGVAFEVPTAVALYPEYKIIIDSSADQATIEDNLINYYSKITYILGGAFIPVDTLDFLLMQVGVIKAYISKPTTDKKLRYNQYFLLQEGALTLTFTTEQNTLSTLGTSENDEGYGV